jgi:serine/threonine protein kinase
MTDDQKTREWEDLPDKGRHDPLGILGWDIGGKYKIRSYIGGGGFGEVYEGFNKNLPDQKLVFKFFKRVQSRDKFAKEAKILCLLDHPNISRVIDFLPDEGALVVAYIDGKDGGQILKESGPLDEAALLKVARAMTGAMAYAHSRKIAHRDIKPSNIMFDRYENVYLIDFGIAKEVRGDATKTAYSTLTPLFAAPERQSGELDYNPFLSDIYEMGVALFNLATNSLPYRNPANPDIHEWGGLASERLSTQLRRILQKATYPDPSKRYQTADEFAAEIKELESAYGKGSGRRRSFIPYIAIIILIAAAVFLGRHEIKRFLLSPESENNEAVIPTVKQEPASAEKISDTTGISETGTAGKTQAAGSAKTTPVERPGPGEAKKEPLVKETEAASKPSPAQEKPTGKEEYVESVGKIPPAPIFIPLLIHVFPPGNALVVVDGKEGTTDSVFSVQAGTHDIEVVHPEYPLFRKKSFISKNQKELSINLQDEFNLPDSANLQISLSPPSDQYIVELSLNGKRHTLLEFPVFNMVKPKGDWRIEANALPLSSEAGTARIDSMVVYPYGGAGRETVRGARGLITLGTAGGGRMEAVPLLIYWSKQE